MNTIEIDGKGDRVNFPGYVEATFEEATHIGFKGTGEMSKIESHHSNDKSVYDGDYWYWQEQFPIIGAVLLKAAPKPERVEVDGGLDEHFEDGFTVYVSGKLPKGATNFKVSWEVTK